MRTVAHEQARQTAADLAHLNNHRVRNAAIRESFKSGGCSHCGQYANETYLIDVAHYAGTVKLRDQYGKPMQPNRVEQYCTTDIYLAELDKCRPLCRICHARETHGTLA